MAGSKRRSRMSHAERLALCACMKLIRNPGMSAASGIYQAARFLDMLEEPGFDERRDQAVALLRARLHDGWVEGYDRFMSGHRLRGDRAELSEAELLGYNYALKRYGTAMPGHVAPKAEIEAEWQAWFGLSERAAVTA